MLTTRVSRLIFNETVSSKSSWESVFISAIMSYAPNVTYACETWGIF